MATDDRKKNPTTRTAALIIFSVFFIALSILAAYQFARVQYRKQPTGRDLQKGAIGKSEKTPGGRNVELVNPRPKIGNETAKTEVKKAAPRQEQRKPVKEKPPAGPILRPTWVGAGKVISLFDGNLRIELNQAGAGDMCRKGSVVGKISSGGADGQKLCLRTGAPANFTYRGGSYTLELSGIAGRGNVYHYIISISH